MNTERLAPNVQALEESVRNFVHSRSDHYFTEIPPHVLEIMVGIAVYTLLIPREYLLTEAFEADREMARLREDLELKPLTMTTILETSNMEAHLKRTGHDQEIIDSFTDRMLRVGVASKRARIAVLKAFQTSTETALIGRSLRDAPVDFCWQAVNNATPQTIF